MAALGGDNRPLPEMVRQLREKSILGQTYGAKRSSTEQQKLELARSATSFCNAIEFSLDFTVY